MIYASYNDKHTVQAVRPDGLSIDNTDISTNISSKVINKEIKYWFSCISICQVLD